MADRALNPDIRQRNNGQWVVNRDMIANPTTDGLFTEVKTASTTGITMVDAQGGRMQFDPTHGTPAQNHADLIYTTKKCFAWADGATFGIRGRFKIAQSATNKLNFFFGITSLQTVGILLDTTGGPATNFSGAGIYMATDSLYFGCVSSVGATQTKTVSTLAGASSSVVDLEVVVKVHTTYAEATFFVDGKQLTDANGIVIKHTFAWSGAAACGGAAGVKMGSATPETGVYMDDVSIYGNEPTT